MNSSTIWEAIGLMIRAEREKAGLTIEQLAERTRLSSDTSQNLFIPGMPTRMRTREIPHSPTKPVSNNSETPFVLPAYESKQTR